MSKIVEKAMKDLNYLSIVQFILFHEEFLKRKEFVHHEKRSVYEHCIMVSYKSYRIAKLFGLDYQKTAIGGLLHDFYYKDWQKEYIKKSFFKQHGFVHAKEASINAKKYFGSFVDEKVNDIILRHMFPLNPTPPVYMEAWIVTFVDKWVSMEIFSHPTKLKKYIGMRGKEYE